MSLKEVRPPSIKGKRRPRVATLLRKEPTRPAEGTKTRTRHGKGHRGEKKIHENISGGNSPVIEERVVGLFCVKRRSIEKGKVYSQGGKVCLRDESGPWWGTTQRRKISFPRGTNPQKRARPGIGKKPSLPVTTKERDPYLR